MKDKGTAVRDGQADLCGVKYIDAVKTVKDIGGTSRITGLKPRC
jgi:hypothetical protein